ncbi:MAG: P-type conjugative transfer protein TrbG [Desulfovibrio sp.]|nr:P-type conjugative transfer protein TrbG [Desulfovibrio sp.]
MKGYLRRPFAALAIFVTVLSFLACSTAKAATPGGEIPPELLNVPDFLSQDVVPLTSKERQALGLSRQWSGRGPAPVLSHSGKLTYVHGASLPTIIASPMQVCDVELQPGEKVNEVIVGDSARWLVETGTAGDTVHLFVKPVDAGLETTAVVTTDRRVYHLRLVSQRSGHTPYVGFVYADAMKSAIAQKRADAEAERERRTATLDGRQVDISGLNFGYDVKGKASWKPERVFDDGERIYIHLPRKVTEMPVLLARRKGENVLVNYRADAGNLVVDGFFDEILLLLGVGKNREEVRIVRR